MKSFTTQMLEGLAKLLQDNQLGDYPPPGVAFSGLRPGVSLKQMPQTPHEVIVLNPYGNNDDAKAPNGTVSVQIRARGNTTDPMSCDDILDPIFDLLHGASYLALVDDHPAFSLVTRQSTIPMGMDSNGRFERADNYAFFGARVTAHRKH